MNYNNCGHNYCDSARYCDKNKHGCACLIVFRQNTRGVREVVDVFHFILHHIFKTTSNISLRRKEIHIVFGLVKYANVEALTSSRKRKYEWTDSRVVFHFHQHGSEYHSQQCYALKPQASVKHCVYFLKEM